MADTPNEINIDEREQSLDVRVNAPSIASEESKGERGELQASGGPSQVEEPRIKTFEQDGNANPSSHPPVSESTSTAALSSPAVTPAVPAPPLKRFSSVSINKKFFEKTAAASASSFPSSSNVGGSGTTGTNGPTSAKSPTPSGNASASRTSTPVVPAPSRLITTKLTATGSGQSTSTLSHPPPSGWNRNSQSANTSAPSSAGTSPMPSSASAQPPFPPSGSANSARFPPVGKSFSSGPFASASKKGGSANSKAWANVQQSMSADSNVRNDFPTAAEAAKGKKAKLLKDQVLAAQKQEAVAAQMQALSETADTFRGVHLDPKHHWDEMEDEDNDFLAGVIEFGDGTQYTVQPAPPPPTTQPAEYSSPASAADSLAPPAPVTKEERFQDDFDRSWPRSSQSRFDHPGPPPPKTWKPAPSPTTSIRDLPPHQQPHPPPPPSIGASSTTSASTRDVGEKRVLFNERSNKLEPYGKPPPQNALGRRNAPPQPQSIAIEQRPSSPPHPQQRQSRFGPPHPHSGREGPSSFGRDLPPHANFQTGGGHKPPGLAPPTMNGAPPFSHGEPHERERERERGRRDGHHGPPGMARTENIPPPPSQPGPNFRRDRSRGRDDYRGHRDGPPPIFLRDRSRDEGRFHPGATGKMGPPPLPLPPPVPKSSDDNIVVTPTSVAVTSTVQSAPPETQQAELPAPTLSPVVDIVEFTKETMHSAAERARLRRQKEEEERENQKERARKKAAELAISAEAKAKEERERREKEEEERKRLEEEKRAEARREEEKRVAQQKEREAEELLRQVEKESMEQPKVQVPPSPARNRTHPPTAPRALLKPTNPSQSDASQSHPSAKVDSWRSKAAPLPPIQPPPPPSALPKPSTLPSHELESLSLPPGDDLEVVDFSDLGKLVGEESPTTLVPPPTSAPPAPSLTSPTVGPSSRRPPRPHASDFFEVPVDGAALAPSSDQHTAAKSETSSWRKPTEVAGSSLEVNVTVANAAESTSLVPHTASEAPVTPKVSPPLASIPRRSTLSSADQPQFRMSGMPSPTQPKHPYKEAPMSALTDTLSRIKGALHGMQSSQDSTSRAEGLNPLSPSAIAFPRARANGSHSKQSSLLDFSFDHPQLTQLARPTTPPPNLTVIRLPRKSRPQTVVGTRQLHFWKLPPRAPRMDILTWDPPIKDLNRRTWSRDEMFFPPEKSLVVRLPGSTSSSRSEGTSTLPPDRKLPGPTPRVQLPSARGHDRSASAATAQLPSPPNSDFNPTSRSPPPELPASTTKSHTSSRSASVSLPANSTEVRSSTPTTAPQRSKPQPKMPAGTDLAFYRPRSSGNVEQEVASPSVMFTVTSELDDPAESGSSKTNNVVSSSDSNPSGSEETPSLDTASTVLTPPPTHGTTTTWAKSPLGFPVMDSPSRVVAPNSAHIKNVWSQADKGVASTENSLRGLADDFPTAIPLSVQDMKSEDGDTPKLEVDPSLAASLPPPTTTASEGLSSRMSAHDAHRAFQQVPTSSSNSFSPTYHSTLLPPASVAVHRPNHAVSAPQPPNLTVRTFPPYTHMGPAPNPAMMYQTSPYQIMPSPALSHRQPINGPAPAGGTPLWMPLSTPPTQHASPYRGPPQPGAPYPPFMSYPLPTPAVSPIYPHLAAPQMAKPVNGSASGSMPMPIGRGRGPQANGMSHNQLMSPIMAPIGMAPYNGGVMDQGQHGGFPPRGPTVSPNHMVYPAQGPPTPGSVYGVPLGGARQMVRSPFEPQNPQLGVYNPVPPTNFMRPSW